MATARRCGLRSFTTFCSMFTVPMTAWVTSPLLFESGAIGVVGAKDVARQIDEKEVPIGSGGGRAGFATVEVPGEGAGEAAGIAWL